MLDSKRAKPVTSEIQPRIQLISNSAETIKGLDGPRKIKLWKLQIDLSNLKTRGHLCNVGAAGQRTIIEIAPSGAKLKQ